MFDDADLDAAVEGAMIAKMRNIGEACTAANRFYVAETRSRRSSPSGWRERMGSMKVGRGTEEGVQVGPLIDEDQRSKVEELVQDAVQKGARAAWSGGEPPGRARATSIRPPCWPTCPTTRVS